MAGRADEAERVGGCNDDRMGPGQHSPDRATDTRWSREDAELQMWETEQPREGGGWVRGPGSGSYGATVIEAQRQQASPARVPDLQGLSFVRRVILWLETVDQTQTVNPTEAIHTRRATGAQTRGGGQTGDHHAGWGSSWPAQRGRHLSEHWAPGPRLTEGVQLLGG